ncbi:PTS fructose transporter subunit IIABC [Latilactobacillus curvatus]|uniref:Fructose-specific PTS transporter subunit EIIC n=2 Tax=Latilactobacillus curvatus TaxID=28038 RepID=A0AAJ5RET6_LATCU|nr:fructose-specific PTS transporter subunit EIIC [Latilactobacillus curvatus]KRK92049.1 PTS system, Fru family, IIC component domain protein [Latilactobacillus curvatus JCM 1096 = DSM 20019]MCP8867307.1 fructose-specific PTS transporter subunit EIIC [Latilactobacillus curvatus]MCP8870842.1 fructose-specific PTS transporter subunit EIIC [Latilactobacillus curvatus]MCT3527061.1 PTS fructose transporter subunit IIC [Latilactobacillus curvatus]MCT3531454.1 PTS fructose transporter subunit IIC [La
MNIQDLLLKDAMIMDLQATTKEAAVDEMVARYKDIGVITDDALYRKDILAREAQSSTGIGEGIAMPHAKDSAVQRATVLFAKSQNGVEYDALDGQPVYLFFMIAAPEGANDTHLQALAGLSSLLINPQLVADLKQAQTPEDVQTLFAKAQAAKDAEDAKEEAEEAAKVQAAAATPADDQKPFIVAVTACPTGIAHTYMAEAALKETAAKMGIDIKVETNGSEGVKHQLTADDINRATGVIIAADKKVDMPRFDGKHLLNRPVIDGIKKPAELIQKTLDEEGSIYHATESQSSEEASADKKTLWSRIYQDLMNGVSNMLPFVVGGGILMAISFLLEQTVGAHSTTFIFLNSLGNNAFNFLIPVLAAYIAISIGDRPALMPGFVGGYMASQATASVLASKSPAGFLGGLAAGFIAGWVIVGLKKVFKNLPQTLDGLKPILIFPVLGLLIVGFIMYFMINPVFAQINLWLSTFLTHLGAGNALLLGAILGGMMSVDMGGPFNKAAYTFAIGVFTTTKDGSLMAAVMAGGMVPPLAIAVAATIFKNKFTGSERKQAFANYVLGISFITEGAIPFAASDPLHVIVSSVIGSAIGGGLTQLWQITVPAPHGGIFVAPLANHGLLFVLAVLIGTFVSALILGLWRPVAKEA